MNKEQKSQLDRPITADKASQRKLRPAATSFMKERDNFRKKKEELVLDPEYQDKYVAIHGNKVVGTSNERLELAIEMAKRFPKGSYFIGKVYPPQA